MTFAQLAVVRTCRATLEVAEWDLMKKTIFEIRRGESCLAINERSVRHSWNSALVWT